MASYSLEDLLYLMARLRDPQDGCPWDKEQDFSTLVAHTIEESYELADAIEQSDFKQIKEELGDVLFQVVFYSELGREQQQFEFGDIITALVEKLIRRHPHVFPAGTLNSRMGKQTARTLQVKQCWETIKSSERQSKQLLGILDDIPKALPALSRAEKLQKRASRVGFDWHDVAPVMDNLYSEITELKEACQTESKQDIEQELGDVLFSVVNVARHLHVDAEKSLRGANSKFERRFQFIENQLRLNSSSVDEASLECMDQLWDKAKESGL